MSNGIDFQKSWPVLIPLIGFYGDTFLECSVFTCVHKTCTVVLHEQLEPVNRRDEPGSWKAPDNGAFD